MVLGPWIVSSFYLRPRTLFPVYRCVKVQTDVGWNGGYGGCGGMEGGCNGGKNGGGGGGGGEVTGEAMEYSFLLPLTL